MKVVLLQKVAGLGEPDEIKEVSEGYARNYLFPRHLAVLASPKAVSEARAHHHRESKKSETDLKQTQKLADRLASFNLAIKDKANEAGFLYAAVGPQKISEGLRRAGFAVDKSQVALAAPIKEPGEYEVKIKLRHGLEADIIVTVIPDK